MSNLNVFFISHQYGQMRPLQPNEKRLISFINERGAKVINLKLLQKVRTQFIYEDSLRLLKTKPWVVAFLCQPEPFPLFVLAIAMQKGCRCLVFVPPHLMADFKPVTNHNFLLHRFDSIETIIKILTLSGI